MTLGVQHEGLGRSDGELLARFSDGGSEEAFRGLVAKYFPMVFGLALRRTRSRETAEEVSQTVFIELSRRAAALRSRPTLAGWLCRCTVNECTDGARREAAHQRKLKAFTEQVRADAGGGGGWSDAVAPKVDDALHALSPGDREVVLLRFFEGRSFRDIGRALGKSEDAAQKQCDRALQRMARWLARHGVSTPSAALAAGLAGHLTTSPPAGSVWSIERISRASVESSTVGHARRLIYKAMQAVTHTKTRTAATAAVIAAIPLTLLWRDDVRLRHELAGLAQPQVADQPALPGAASRQPHSRSTRTAGQEAAGGAGEGVAENLDALWEKALLDPDPVRRMQQIASLIAKLTPETAPAVGAVFEKLRHENHPFDSEFHLFLRSWGKLDGAAAIAYAKQAAHDQVGDAGVVAVLAGWASSDAASARAWIEALPEGKAREDAITGLIDGWSMTDFAAAAAYAESRPRSVARDEFRRLLLERSLVAGGVPAAQEWFNSISNDEHNSLYKQRAFDEVIQAMLYRDPAAAAQWIAQQGEQPYLAGQAISATASKLAEAAPAEAMQWLKSLPAAARADLGGAYRESFGQWMRADLNAAGAWLSQNAASPYYDTMASQYSQTAALESRDTALAWADSIQDPDARDRAAIHVVRIGQDLAGHSTPASLRAEGFSDQLIAQELNPPSNEFVWPQVVDRLGELQTLQFTGGGGGVETRLRLPSADSGVLGGAEAGATSAVTFFIGGNSTGQGQALSVGTVSADIQTEPVTLQAQSQENTGRPTRFIITSGAPAKSGEAP